VSRYAPVGYVISRVFAHDADFANNARLTYRIVHSPDRPPAEHLFDVDPDLGAVSIAGDLRRADRDHYELAISVTDGEPPAHSAIVTLTVNLVSTAWSEPLDVSGLERSDDDDKTHRVADVLSVFSRHRLILVVLAIVTVFLTFLLVVAVVVVKYRQVNDINVYSLCYK